MLKREDVEQISKDNRNGHFSIDLLLGQENTDGRLVGRVFISNVRRFTDTTFDAYVYGLDQTLALQYNNVITMQLVDLDIGS